MGKGSGEAYYVYLNMMVISGKCEFKVLCFKNTLFISLTLILLIVSAGIWKVLIQMHHAECLFVIIPVILQLHQLKKIL